MKLKTQCLRHKRYPTKERAEEELIKVNSKYKNCLDHVYHCQYCWGWHMATDKKTKSKNLVEFQKHS